MWIYITAPFILAVAILFLIKVCGHRLPTRAERERLENERKQKEAKQLVKFMKEHPEITKEFFHQPGIKALTEEVLKEKRAKPKDDRK